MTHPVLKNRKDLHWAALSLDAVFDRSYRCLPEELQEALSDAMERVADLRFHFDERWAAVVVEVRDG